MCRFETDLLEYSDKVVCAFRKTKNYQNAFRAGGRNGIECINIMASKPIGPYCHLHLPSSTGHPPLFRNSEKKWMHTLERTCLHCGCKPSFRGQTEDHRRLKICMKDSEGCCTPCPSTYLSAYSRHGPLPPTVATYHYWNYLRKSHFYWRAKT